MEKSKTYFNAQFFVGLLSGMVLALFCVFVFKKYYFVDYSIPLKPLSMGGVLPKAFEPCLKDILQHCAEVTPGGGRIKNCLMEKNEVVAPACLEFLKTQ